MAVESKIQTDYFKLYIDFEKDLDLSSLTKILKALEDINYHICLENNINYENNKLKISNVYTGSLWFDFSTLQGIVCSLIANLISETLKMIGLKKRLYSEKELEMFKERIIEAMEIEIEGQIRRNTRLINTKNPRIEEYRNKLNLFLSFVQNELANLTIKYLTPKHIETAYYNILKELKILKASDPDFEEDILFSLDNAIRATFYNELVYGPGFTKRWTPDDYMEYLLKKVNNLIDEVSSEEQEVKAEVMTYKNEPETNSSKTTTDLILDVCNDDNIKACAIQMITKDGREIKLDIKEIDPYIGGPEVIVMPVPE
ncbi:hypothetical protein COE15_27880 [Bacillus cereus]|uniref:hypothetical protein n=1 Tax=Bacillus sp. AFS023182 TaxID=2033492 RepID=UPI000BF76F70|nr:hypothetical protein [Bacillus sp. AFS023182]PFD94699.1 hypothetical protein CN288_27310 [Bacillus sp. AFS023182]PGX89543.1 hypothetical protein COE15_27880 [Bacillus cereus]